MNTLYKVYVQRAYALYDNSEKQWHKNNGKTVLYLIKRNKF